MPPSFVVSTALVLLSLSCQQVVAVNLDSQFYDLFSLSRIYEPVKYGDIPYLREAFLSHHLSEQYLSENTARLLYALARAFIKSGVNSDKDFLAAPFKLSMLDEKICNNDKHYKNHKHPDIGCHFHIFTICVAGLLENPAVCLERVANPSCVQAVPCAGAYTNVMAEESRAWLQLWAEDSMNDLLQYSNYTATQIAALKRKSCLHDSQFMSAVFNLALCSEISRLVAFTEPRVTHPLAELYCPDPCLRAPCAKASLMHQLVNTSCSTDTIGWESQHAIAHRWDDLQLQRQHGIKPAFTCHCRVGKWTSSKEACERVEGGSYLKCSPTLANKLFPCSVEGTSVCYDHMDSEEVPFICTCKEGYAGVFCQEKLSSCFHKVINIELDGKVQRMTGNRMCNVNQGGVPIVGAVKNKCIADPLGDTRYGYKCTCSDPYFALISVGAENCLGVKRACDSELCINGECASSPDLLTAAACRCHEGWGGKRCDLPMPDWGVWSACRPYCGANRTRLRERRGDRRQPARLFLETELCPDRYCRDYTDEAEYSSYQTLLYASSVDSGALVGSALLALLVIGLMRFWQPRFASREARSG